MNSQSNIGGSLAHIDLFSKMSEEEICNFEKCMCTRMLRKGNILRFPELHNKYVFLVKHGIVKLASTDEDGKDIIKYLAKAGQLFGLMPLLDLQENPNDYAIAHEDSMISFIDAETLKQWMQARPDLRTKVYRQIGNRIQRMEARLVSIVFREARVRIYNFVVELAKEFGTMNEDCYQVRNFLTHDDIAKLTATSRQTVNSTLNDLRDQQLIEYNNEMIRIPYSSPLLKSESTSHF